LPGVFAVIGPIEAGWIDIAASGAAGAGAAGGVGADL
jgi:hypothetical protein